MAAHLAHLSGAWTELVDLDCNEAHEGAKCGIQYSILQNFAEFEFNWHKEEVTLRAFGSDLNSSPFVSTTWNFTYLTAPSTRNESPFVKLADYIEKFQDPVLEGFAQGGDWICVNHRGPVTFAMKAYGIAGPGLIICFAMIFPLLVPLVITFGLIKLQGRKHKSRHNSEDSRQS
jgi:hypothetical protein